jgi:uncharacterized repeat protein (TIGR02543 family)
VVSRRRAVRTVSLALVALLVGAAYPVVTAPAAGGLVGVVSDDFNASGLNAGLWSVVDPLGDGSVAVSGGGSGAARLVLGVPAGRNHDLFGVNESLRVVQPVAGLGDFGVEAGFDSLPTLRYQMQGIVVEQDARNWLRVEFLGNNNSLYVYVAATVDGVTSTRINQKVPGAASMRLRVSRAGDVWTVARASAGGSFVTAGTFNLPLTVSAVGPYVGNSSSNGTSAPAYTAQVDYFFDTGAPIVPEDGGSGAVLHGLTSSVVGSGSVAPASGSFVSGSSVTVTATPAAGWEFAGWSGALSSTANPLTFTITADTALTATFTEVAAPSDHSLTVGVVGSGSVAPASGSFVSGSSVTVTATPAAGWEFAGWSGALTSTANPLTFTITADTALTATFTEVAAPPDGPVTSDDFNASGLNAGLWSVVDPLGDGSVAVSGGGSGSARLVLGVPAGRNHDLFGVNESLRVVQPVVGGGDFGVEAGFDSLPTSRYQMQGILVEQDAQNWLRVEFLGNSTLYLYVAATVDGVTTTRIYQSIPAAASMRLRVSRAGDVWTVARASASGPFVTAGSFTQPLSVTAVGPYVGNSSANGTSAPAYTAQVDYFFDTGAPIVPEDGGPGAVLHGLTSSVVGSGTVAPASGSYAPGSSVTVTATPAAGWQFTGWSGALTSTANPLTFTIDADTALTATFTQVADGTPPVIGSVVATPTGAAVRVAWNTNEVTTGAVDHGLTAGYERGSAASAAPGTAHEIELAGYQPGDEIHYRVRALDLAGNPAQTGDLVVTVPSVGGPTIEVWYGDEQHFGQLGVPQRWVNVLGRATDSDGLQSLAYRLNGGAWSPLEIGPDGRRLLGPGDFNVEIDHAALVPGPNSVEIRAVDALGGVTIETVTLHWTSGQTWPLTYDTAWAGATAVTDSAQVVDGRWQLVPGGVRTVDIGYDRLLAIGDLSWVNYDATVTATVHSIDPSGFNPTSGTPAMFFTLGWPGHTDRNDGSQPLWYYWPTGAFAGYGWDTTSTGHLFVTGNQGGPSSNNYQFSLQLGVEYTYRMQAVSEPGGVRYRLKAWRSDTPEPATWTLEILEDAGPASGSLLLVAHHVDVTFGDVRVTPL